MNELAFIIFAALPVSPYILVAAGLAIAVVVLVGALFLFRSPARKKGAPGRGKADLGSNAPAWQLSSSNNLAHGASPSSTKNLAPGGLSRLPRTNLAEWASLRSGTNHA